MQLEADLSSDAAVWDRLRASGAVEIGASEEEVGEKDLGGSGYSVAFDPLVSRPLDRTIGRCRICSDEAIASLKKQDGSSVFDANFAVGSIFGIWPGRGLEGRTGGEQAGAAYSLYGPRTVLVVATSWTEGAPPTVNEYRLGPGRIFSVRPSKAASSGPESLEPTRTLLVPPPAHEDGHEDWPGGHALRGGKSQARGVTSV